VRFKALLEPQDLSPHAASSQWVKTPERETMQAELQALEAQYKGLQTLVGELLMTNQKLREEVAALRQRAKLTEQATHPQPHQDH
jgi:regulator of replication initiation timing